jgi:hypothetical protein
MTIFDRESLRHRVIAVGSTMTPLSRRTLLFAALATDIPTGGRAQDHCGGAEAGDLGCWERKVLSGFVDCEYIPEGN